MFGGGSTVASQSNVDLQLAFLSNFEQLTKLLADPQGTAKRVAELKSATAEHQKAHALLVREQRALNEERAKHRKTIDDERAAHTRELEELRAAWYREQGQRRSQIEADEAQVARDKAAAKRDADASATLRQQLEQKLGRLRDIAA
jgi:hypothetical protein